MSEIEIYEQQYRERANRFGIFLLLGHLPFLVGVAVYCGTSITLAVAGGLLLTLGPSLLYFLARHSLLVSLAIGVSGMSISALLIHLGRGAIEMHFHIFMFLALLIIFGRAWPILAAAATIAVHHIAFWIFLPASVFDHTATLGTVAVHAFFVVAEALPAIYIAQRLGKAIRSEGVIKGHLQEAAGQVMAAASQVCTNGNSLSQDTQKQAEILEQTSGASQSISSRTSSTAQKSKVMSTLMVKTEGTVLRTGQAINELAAQMEDVNKANEAVVNIIKIIDRIAFQTNILALNAAVEAARAGEAGLGFAVVADEVRNLAQSCAQAAEQTSQLIHDSTAKTKQGDTQLSEVSKLMASLTQVLNEVKQLIEEVSGENGEQAGSLQQISGALSALQAITSRNAASAEENAAAGEQLRSQAVIMQHTVEQLSA